LRNDTLVVWKLDRLARSMRQLIATVEDLRARGIELRSLTESIDTATPGGTNKAVAIQAKHDGWIAVTPLEPQTEPPHLAQLKAEVASRWPISGCSISLRNRSTGPLHASRLTMYPDLAILRLSSDFPKVV
jgi:hypothetical protein